MTAVTERVEGLVRLEVDGIACVSYPRLTGDVEEGDEVLVNEQARLLELGSGGFDILYANLTRGLGLAPEEGAHVMALPYMPGQLALVHGEERSSVSVSLEGLPVVCCSLHSQLAPVCAGIGSGVDVAYVQVGGGALPVSLSDTVRELKARGLLRSSIAVAPCLDGDVQCVSVAAALAYVVKREGYSAVVAAIGPGIVGTGTSFGHGGLAAAEVANVATRLAGKPILALRVSHGDPRARHRVVSHHTLAVRSLCLDDITVAWPSGLAGHGSLTPTEVDVTGWQEACAGLPLSHMGRGPDEDPWFFAAAFAAGRLARAQL